LPSDHYVIAPDQRGYARSSKPEGVENYTPDKPVADLLALADHLGIGQFALVGHDWGGAIAWMAALQNPGRIARLIIVNAPHPLVFQRSLFDDPGQRKASQYIRFFRDTGIDKGLVGAGLERFLSSTFAQHVVGGIAGEEKAIYMDQWGQPGAMTAMLNWYRASPIAVPETGAASERPAWLDAPFPPITQPSLVIWGMKDKALLGSQLDGLDALVPDLTITRIAEGGHFVPWEKPDAVTAAMRDWLAARGG
jgi:pimeloyl-ACP methyl ester carboxylesterase